MFICVSAPPGIGPSATVEAPPPMLRPPQVSDLRTAPAAPPDFTAPQVPPAAPVVKLRYGGGGVEAEQVGSPTPPLQTSLAPVPPAIDFQEQLFSSEQKLVSKPVPESAMLYEVV